MNILTFQDIIAKKAFNQKVRIKLWKVLAKHSRHKMDLIKSLERQQKRANRSLAIVYSTVLKRMHSGSSFGLSFVDFASSEEIMLISEGERSGQLSKTLELAVKLLEGKQRIYKALRSALAYPIFLMCLLLVLLITVSVYVVPRLTSMSDPITWTGAAYGLYLISSFVASLAGIITFCLIIGLLALIIYTLPFWTGYLRFKADCLPPWSIYRLTIGVPWLFAMATLIRSGKSITNIFDDMLKSEITTPWLYERLLAISIQYGEGKNLGEAMSLSRTGFPDPVIVEELYYYASLPDFDKQLDEIAEEWLNEGVELIVQQVSIIRIVTILFIGFIICGLVLSITSLQQQLSTGGGF